MLWTGPPVEVRNALSRSEQSGALCAVALTPIRFKHERMRASFKVKLRHIGVFLRRQPEGTKPRGTKVCSGSNEYSSALHCFAPEISIESLGASMALNFSTQFFVSVACARCEEAARERNRRAVPPIRAVSLPPLSPIHCCLASAFYTRI